jgi:hypothetical protein
MKKYLKIITAILLLAILISCGDNSDDMDLPDTVDVAVPETDKATLTLGVIDIHKYFEADYTTRYVSGFNQENENYQMEVVNYTQDDIMRLRTELTAGSGPDIIYSLYYEDSVFAPLMSQGVFTDLWQFIDADPDINRGDFFQNILHAMQSPDGSLQMIAKTDYPDAAWSFVRRYLLPDSYMDIRSGLPMRLDLFDNHVAKTMDAGSGGAILLDGPAEIKLQPLTENGANQLREITENVSNISRPNETVTNIVTEVLPSFLTGSRTAQEAAGIIQNRVQMYLHVRS